MAKLNHQKRQRPRPPVNRRRTTRVRTAEQRAKRDLERWRRGGQGGS